MTLEQEYIKKIKLNLGKISKHIEVSIGKQQYSLSYFIELRYNSKNHNGFAILRLHNETKIYMHNEIKIMTELDNLVLLTFLNIIPTFKSYLKQDPLFFYNYAYNKQIEYFQKLNEKSKINFDLITLYDLIVKKDCKNEIEFLKNMLPSKSYKTLFLDTNYTNNQFSLIENFQIKSLLLKISLKKDMYCFTFPDKSSISFSFDHALILLSYFKINEDFKLFDIIGQNIDLIGKNDVVNTQINSYLEKTLLENQIKNF